MSATSAISSTISGQQNLRTHYYSTPFSNREQEIKQITLYVLATLTLGIAIALTVATIIGEVSVLVGAIGIPVALIVAGILFYIAKTTPFFRVIPGQIVRGPFGGDYEKDFMRALNQGMLETTTQSDIEKRKDHPFFPNIQTRYNHFIQSLQEAPPTQLLIPKKIHLIWIGPKPASDNVLAVVQSWKNFHPDWECDLWDNTKADQIISAVSASFPKVKEAWDAALSWAEKADILRYCILYTHGGFYADTDLPCVGHIDELHYFSNFYCGLQDVNESSSKSKFLPPIVCNNAAIGSSPNHPILKEMLQRLQPYTDQGSSSEDVLWRTGPTLLTTVVREFTTQTAGQDQTYNAPLVLPPVYFYPMPVCRSPLLVVDNGYLPFESSYPYLTPVSKAVHLWEGSWVKFSWADIKRTLHRCITS
jgi:mannosyltransferase OCH1-like enzyme